MDFSLFKLDYRQISNKVLSILQRLLEGAIILLSVNGVVLIRGR